ncbi:MAG TPA: hypothetical protein VLC74_07635 [Rhizomicrobium sp.]|nr:hypothetical protein [Rhizomicrobium sp.]
MEIWVHIGGEKTGSTSIQHAFAKKREELKADRILYPQSLGERSHLKLYCFASDGPFDELKGQLGVRSEAEVESFRRVLERDLRSEIERHVPEVLVISNEHSSSRLFRPSEVGRVYDLLSSFSRQIKIVFYARPQWELLLSAYSTHIKEGGTHPFGMPGPHELEAKYNYRRILELWAARFGAKNIVVRPYASESPVSRDVVSDFCGVADLPAVGESIPRHNTGLSVPALEFLRRFNRLVPRTIDFQFNPLRGNIGHLLERYKPEQKLTADSKLVRKLWDWSEPINSWVSEQFLGGAPLFAPPKTGENPLPVQNFTLDQAFQVFAYLWQLKQKQIINAKR